MFSNNFMRYMYGVTSPIIKEKDEKQQNKDPKPTFLCLVLKCASANK